ncbi:hypothetical protein KIN20_019220 [Parelaphostrongylus tenuis]|uniref:Uncharacterized protein n=1 Tax=Parelaphostrongylus tenuis TaxID=148309 RepID=A0AAD5N588_PARTN|nr:hypothetical protein KIN20_019220 [Parelaphostrongylus tenuis]
MNEGDTANNQREVHHISTDVSSRISTAQVIVSVSCAVRQLIDNSLDGCAQVIEIRTKNNGYDSIEVIDDGTGIPADSFDSLCKPHATSKLSELNDFGKLCTLGFRGEALNALCALGSVTIITRSASTSLGSKLSFDHHGNICGACFSLSRPDVKFICSNIVAGKRVQSICTPGKATTREVVFNLFGGRTDKTKMVEILRCHPNDEFYRLSGFVSSCEHGFGRSTADRQFVYVNRRPVDYPKICRVINEVYQQYNRSQYPTLVLYIELPPEMIDVNVTPDKRTVLFDHEKELLALIRSSVLATFHLSLGSFTSVEDRNTKDTKDNEHCDLSDAASSKSNKALPSNSSLFSFLRSDSAKTILSSSDIPPPKNALWDFQHAVTSVLKQESGSSRKSMSSDSERRKFSPSLMRNLSRGFEHSIEKDSAVIDRMERAIDQRDKSTGIQKEAQKEVPQTSTQKISFSMSLLKERLKSLRNIKAKEEQASQELEFCAALVPDENKAAEEELNRALKKSDFREMSVIGQFNKGFIVTLLRNHLFLVDQHATQETLNWELFKLLYFEITRDILEANGFGFEFKDGEDGCAIPLLVSTPVLHSWNFDKSDIEEILAVVSEFPGTMYRPAKLRRIFASRACRKSVMIGTALNTSQMQTIIQHLGTLDQPWNCPHGRPTLRHLADLRNINQAHAATT